MGRGQMSSFGTHPLGSGFFDGVHIARTQHSVVDFPEEDDRFDEGSTYVTPTYTLPPLMSAHEEGKPFKGILMALTPDEKDEFDLTGDASPAETGRMTTNSSSSGTLTSSSMPESPQITPIEEKVTLEVEDK